MTGFCILLLCISTYAAEAYRVDCRIGLKAGDDSARISLEIEDGRPVKALSFRIDPARYSELKANGKLIISGENVQWMPPKKNARLRYRVTITRERKSKNADKSYDALMTQDWALFRGDRLIPSMKARTRKGARSHTLLHFDLPKGWAANTGWPIAPEENDRVLLIDDADRRFDRPTGWMMAGKLGTRRDKFGETYVSVTAPLDSAADRMGWLSLVGLVYPEMEKAFGHMPRKLLIVSGDDPLWRGGLSGPNSLYFHASRRAISENGSSPLLHELTHLITRINGSKLDDWIAEGLAEYYGIELLYRAGGISATKREQVLARQAAWGKSIKQLRKAHSRGPNTARAVQLFAELDLEIRHQSHGKRCLDDVVRALMIRRSITLGILRAEVEKQLGKPSSVLQQAILEERGD